MYKYVLKRLLLLIPILLGVTFIVHTIMSLTPGDPGRLILGNTVPQSAVDQLNHELGFDKPFLTKYVDFVVKAVQGDFGNAYRTGKPVIKEITERFPTTLLVAVLGIVLTTILGIPAGILAAVKQYSAMDIAATVAAMLMAAIPGFWLALMLIILFSQKLGWLPSFGIGSWKHFILPMVVLAIPSSAGILRLTRTTMLETIRQDYIRTARAKGATEKTIIWKHALKNALLPVVTVLGMSFGTLLGGTVIIEYVFSIPGIGSFMLTAIRQKDIPEVMGTVLFLAALFCIIMVLVDILYAFIDPRIKARYIKG